MVRPREVSHRWTAVEILRVNAVSGGELFGREPVMVVGGRGIVHRVDVFAEVGLGLRVAFEDDEEVIEAKIVCDGAAVVWCEGGRGGGVAGEGGVFGFVDGVGDLWAGNLGAEGVDRTARAREARRWSDSACAAANAARLIGASTVRTFILRCEDSSKEER